MSSSSTALAPPPRRLPGGYLVHLYTNNYIFFGIVFALLARLIEKLASRLPQWAPEEAAAASLLIGILLFLFGVYRARRAHALYRDGLVGQARILDLHFADEPRGTSYTISDLRDQWIRKLSEMEAARRLRGVETFFGCLARLGFIAAVLGIVAMAFLVVLVTWFNEPVSIGGQTTRDPMVVMDAVRDPIIALAAVAALLLVVFPIWHFVRDRLIVPSRGRRIREEEAVEIHAGKHRVPVDVAFELEGPSGSLRARDRAEVGETFGATMYEPALYHPERYDRALLLDGTTIGLKIGADGQWTSPNRAYLPARFVVLIFVLFYFGSWLFSS